MRMQEELERLVCDALNEASQYAVAAVGDPQKLRYCVEIVYDLLPLAIRLVVSRETITAIAVRIIDSWANRSSGVPYSDQWIVVNDDYKPSRG